MKKKNLIISLLTLGGMLLSSCMLAREKQDLVWSKWYDNGDGTHTRHNLNDISQTETDVHHFVLTSSLEEPTEVTPGKAIYTCEQCACKEEKVVPPTGNYVFNQKVVDDKYLLERYSEHSACYYMSSVEGAFGDPRYVFEVSDVPSGYTEVDYVESDGRQWIDTGVKNNGVNKVSANNGSRLGIDYIELEYIESTGTQYIKTGVYGCAKWTITIEFTHFGTRQLMGYNGNGANYWGVAEKNEGRNTEEGDYETYTCWSGRPKAGNKDVIVDDFGDSTPNVEVRYLNGVQVQGPGDISGDISSIDYELFALDNGQAPCFAKLYSAKVENKGVLTHDFVPAQRISDGHIGLFDVITNTFITNKGTGDFVKGPEVETPEAIPVEYQEVEFIQTDGLAYTVLPDLEHFDRWQIDVQYTSNETEFCILGNLIDPTHGWELYTGEPKDTYCLYVSDEGSIVSTYSAFERAKISYSYVTNMATINGNEIGERHLVAQPKYLLSYRDGQWSSKAKLYGFSVYFENNKVLNLVPCYRVLDGVIGLYDTVSNSFLTSNGSGNFAKGPEIDRNRAQLPIEYQQVEYVQSNGNQWINANVVFNSGDSAAQIVDVQFLDESMRWCGSNWYLQYGYDPNYVNTHDRVTMQQLYSNRNLKTFVNGAEVSDINFTNTPASNIGTGVFRLMDKDNKWYNNDASTTDIPSSQILYSLKIYKNNLLERDFIPCYKKATEDVGLFDLVSGTFFANEGTAPLAKGADINIVDGSKDYNELEKANIPDYYYQLNYIQSNALQCLDTGIIGGATIETTIKFYNNNSMQIMGYGDIGGHFFGVGPNNKYLGTSIDAGNVDYVVVDVSDSILNKGNIKINNEDAIVFDVPELEDNTLKFFSVGTEANKCVALMYAAKVYQGGVLVRDFVPVMQKQTKAVGLYDLVNQRFYESSTKFSFDGGGIMYSGIDTGNINVFCNLTSDKSHPFSSKINSYRIYERNTLVKDFVSVIRNSDGVVGLYDIKNNQFYTSNSEFPLTYGKIIGHKLDEGRVTKKATHDQNGEIVYKCVYTNEEIHVSTDCTAYKVTFISDNGNLSSVKIFNNNDPNNYQMSMVGYTRNPNTYNYSKSGAYIYFEIPDDGHDYIVTATSGKVVKVEETDRQYKITGISSDVFVQLKLNDINA